ncbi:MAG: chemotaxis-specific protein-glutamate methyltransferase CheB [Gemmatimonadaceae bacterium]|nr:chemotaxis-specific protein-glutamate methyltransferase CheB [Gemmatimonadaceae bacterium]
MAGGSSRRSVLVVDDSAFIRRVVCDAIEASADLRVAGEAADGHEAVRLVHALGPDLVTLDIEMPGMSGLEALGYIMSECPRPVVVLSGQEAAAGGDATIRALELGAVDFVRKPSWAQTLDVETLGRRLLQALREAGTGRVDRLARSVPEPRRWRASPIRSEAVTGARPEAAATSVIAIAASTGGPRTLAALVPTIPRALVPAIVIVQHMPAGFTGSLAARLHELGPRPVHEARDGMPLLAGHVYMAAGGWHLRAARGARDVVRCVLGDDAPVHGVRPAADVTFASLASVFGAGCIGVVLTGMGRDGAQGARAVRAGGGAMIVQDPETCVVSGMGQAVLAAGAADAVLPLEAMPDAMARLCAASRGR